MKQVPRENSPLLPVSKAHSLFWSGQASASDVLVRLPSKCVDELDDVATACGDKKSVKVRPDSIPACARFAAECREILFEGVGMIIIDRVPVERYTTTQNRQIGGVLANLISPLMTQDIKGTYLYDVIDTGRSGVSEGDTGVAKRRSKTNFSQPFHTDGPWFKVPPHLVGLFCISPAAVGGLSQVASLSVALDKICREVPDNAPYRQPVAWNKMGEHQALEKPTRELPIVGTAKSGMHVRHYADYVRTGFELTDRKTPQHIDELLTRLDEALAENACRPFKLEAGQFQYVNNWTLAHARAGFSDEPGSQTGRHLVRLWNESPRPEKSSAGAVTQFSQAVH